MAISPFRPRPVNVTLGGINSASNAAREFRKIEENFRQWTLHLSGQSGEVLREALKPTLELAKKYCPYKTGALRNSGYIEVRHLGRGNGYQAEIGFGKNGKPSYTIHVHEVDRYHAPPTRWKFLQIALVEDTPNIQRRLAEGVKRSSGV